MRIDVQDRNKWHGRFLWWPRRIDGQIVWLEHVWYRQRLVPGYFGQVTMHDFTLTVPKEI